MQGILSLVLNLLLVKGDILRSEELYFEPVQQTDSTVTMRLVADAHSYIDFVYALHANDYLLDMKVKAVNMSDKLLPTKTVHVTWNSKNAVRLS